MSIRALVDTRRLLPLPTVTTYSYDFTGSNGAAMPAAFSKAVGVYGDAAYPTTTPTIQSNKLRIASGSTAAWSGAGSAFFGNTAKPEGDTGIPQAVSNGTYAFKLSFASLKEQYPSIGLRLRSADLWSSGNGQNLFRNGGYSLVMGVKGNTIDLIRNYDGATIVGGIPVTFALNMGVELELLRKKLSFRFWDLTGSKPTAWTYSADGVIADESDGNIGFSVFNGPDAEQKYLDIDDFVHTTPILTLGTTRTSPPASAPDGWIRQWTEEWLTAAAAGTAAGQFMNVYNQSFQPYDDGGTVGNGALYPRQMISSHDGVMDVKMDGLKASAGTFGPAATAFDWIGGRFTIRMKTLGGYNNGPAFMLWPSSEVWADGEIDFPESVSGRGGTSGFQDAPWIHHHKMVQGQEAQAQDVALLVSWRDWHEYTCEWNPPGTGPTPSTGNVRYLVDGVEVYNTTTDVPKTKHRWCFQIGDWGAPGNIYIDWATIDIPGTVN